VDRGVAVDQRAVATTDLDAVAIERGDDIAPDLNVLESPDRDGVMESVGLTQGDAVAVEGEPSS
jgi:hypothetical protein